METISDRLKRLMAEHGHSYQYLADKIGVTKGTVSNWVHGQNIKPSHLEKIAKHHRVSKLWLRDGVENPLPDQQLLFEVIEAIETALAESGAEISPDKRARLYAELYALSADTGRISGDMARRLVRLVA